MTTDIEVIKCTSTLQLPRRGRVYTACTPEQAAKAFAYWLGTEKPPAQVYEYQSGKATCYMIPITNEMMRYKNGN